MNKGNGKRRKETEMFEERSLKCSVKTKVRSTGQTKGV